MHALSIIVIAVVSTRAEGQSSVSPADTNIRQVWHWQADLEGQGPPEERVHVLSFMTIPLKEPFQLHQDADVLNAATVGKVETFGKVGLQVGFDLLIRFLTL